MKTDNYVENPTLVLVVYKGMTHMNYSSFCTITFAPHMGLSFSPNDYAFLINMFDY